MARARKSIKFPPKADRPLGETKLIKLKAAKFRKAWKKSALGKRTTAINLQIASWFDRLPILPRRLRPFFAKHWLIVCLCSMLFALCSIYIFKDLPSPKKLALSPLPTSTQVFDRNGKLLYEIYADKNRVPVKLSDLPDYIKWATVASEDKDFYKHHGFDLKGILRAAYNTIFHRSLQGGSTITQQLVKNSLLTPERTVRRKIREAVLTLVTETIYSKDEILEMYINQTPYGGTAWGIEAAAQTYFNKHAKDLTLPETTLLAGLPASPTRFSPFGVHPELAKERQTRVLEAMAKDDYITDQQVQEAKNQELHFAPMINKIQAPHFVLWIKELLVDQYGERVVEQGGLKVATTLDLDLQNLAQEAVASQVAKLKNYKVTNGASLVTNPKSGEILAMVGSHDYFDIEHDGNVNVVLRPRQPGSSIKPLNYGLAFEKKTATPATVLNDMRTCFYVAGQKSYCPSNYDNSWHGPIQVRFALGNSINIPAVKVLALNGVDDFIKKATEMGITTWNDPSKYGLSLTLGGGEVTMYDMATAFSVFANLGIRKDLYAIQKVEDLNGKTIFEHSETEGPRVLSMESAYLVSHILLDNNARSMIFGSGSPLIVKNHPEVSVKTGTTNDNRDAWTIGYNSSRLAAVWMGNNNNTPMSYSVAGVMAAAPVWNQVMNNALKDQKQEWPLKPEGIVGAQICALSGKFPNPASPCQTRFEYFFDGTVPAEIDNPQQMVEMDKTTGMIANDQTPPENREVQAHSIIFDALNIPYCLDCANATQSATIKYPLLSSITPAP